MVPTGEKLLFLSLPGEKEPLGWLWRWFRILKDAFSNAYVSVASSFSVHFHKWSLYHWLLYYVIYLCHKRETNPPLLVLSQTWFIDFLYFFLTFHKVCPSTSLQRKQHHFSHSFCLTESTWNTPQVPCRRCCNETQSRTCMNLSTMVMHARV